MGNIYPGSVIYLYYKYTSCLLGGLYHYGQGTGYHWRLHWDDPVEYTIYRQLGTKDLEWLILHGCQAVITANEDGTYNPMGLQCFHWTQGKKMCVQIDSEEGSHAILRKYLKQKSYITLCWC